MIDKCVPSLTLDGSLDSSSPGYLWRPPHPGVDVLSALPGRPSGVDGMMHTSQLMHLSRIFCTMCSLAQVAHLGYWTGIFIELIFE